MPSFKVPCPSCEAQVLIKNPNLIGTKVECPKCKYRFKVEEPAAETPADDKAKAKKEKDAKPKKKGKSKTTGILAVVGAIVLLGVVGYFVVGGKKKEPVKNSPPPRPMNAGPTGGTGDGTDPGTGDQKDDKKDEKAVPKPVYSLPTSDKDATNLLPGAAVAVYRFNMDQIRQNTTFNGLFDANADLFKASMGFEIGNVAAYHHAVVGPDRGSFGVLRLTAPVAAKDVAPKMSLEPGPKMVKDRALHAVKSNPFVAAVGQALAARSVLGDVYDTMPGKPAGPTPPQGVCFYDTQTILVGDLDVVDQFLAGLKANGYPEFRTNLSGADVKDAKDVKGELTTNTSYRTIDGTLKRNLNAVDDDPQSPPMILYAELLAPKEYDPTLFKKSYKAIGDVLDPVLRRAKSVGMNLTTFTNQRFTATVRIVTENDGEARTVANEHLTPGLMLALPPLSMFFYTNIELRGVPGATPAGPPGAIGPGTPMGPPRGGKSGGDDVGTPDGGPGAGAAGPPRGSVGGPPPMGGSAQPPRGGVGMPGPPPMGGSGQFGPPPMGGSGQFGPPPVGGQFPPALPTTPSGLAPSFVELKTIDNIVTVVIDLTWSDDVYRRTLNPRLLSLGNQTKGKMAVFAGSYGFHPLAEAVVKYREKYKAFPRGTSEKPVHVGVGLPYPPSQRVSFYSELLPFMERSKSLSGPDRSIGWAEEKLLSGSWIDKQAGERTPGSELMSNLVASGSWVPELLVPYYPPTSWRATSPMAPDKVFGGTNFVAIAGVGVEAARLDPTNPDAAKTVGITGYGWGSKVEDVTDGLDKTIYLMQVPPGLSRPWAAGGGATIMGLNEKDPMADFAHARPDGEVGAHAIMGDGTIRWIPAKIDPKVFLGMATRAGGEALPDLDKLCPKVELKKVEVLVAVPPTVDEIPAPRPKIAGVGKDPTPPIKDKD